MRRRPVGLTWVTLSMVSATTPSALMAAVPASPQAVGVSAIGNPWGLVLGLLFLLALAALAWWLVRRMGGLQGAGGGMRVLAALPVGPRERVVLVEIAGEQWALGVAPGRVTLLHRFEQPVIDPGKGGHDDFSRRMRQLLQQGLGR